MATRDLGTNSRRISERLRRLESFADRELARQYASALEDIQSQLVSIFNQYNIEGELTRAEASRFLRLSGLQDRLFDTVQPRLLENERLLKEVAQVSFERSFYEHAWAVDQSIGVSLGWDSLDPNATRAAVGLIDDGAALAGIMPQREVENHAKLLSDAFERLGKDTRRWIGEAVTQSVIKGDSVQKTARRIEKEGLAKSRHSAERIARTETLRARGVGAQVSYEEAQDKGANIRQVWDATLDMRTRPEHAALDGVAIEPGADGWDVPGIGIVKGPRRSGVASFDINCRCRANAEMVGVAPRVRRIRDEGIQPYQTFQEWAERNGIQANRFGQQYNFLDRS